MSLISASIPNLINGVSQQPPSLRLKTQGSLQENGLASVVNGLSKRPGTNHIADLGNIPNSANCFIHTMRRDENEYYTLIITSDAIRVFDKDGVERDVNYTPEAFAYLSLLNNPAKQLAATTIADYTFILNKTKITASDTTTTPVRNKEALVYVKQGDYSTKYKLKITKNGVAYTREIETMSSTQGSNSDTRKAEKSIQTDRLAQTLIFTNVIDSTYYGGTSTTNAALNISGLQFTQHGSVIHVEATDGTDFTISCEDSRGDNHMFAFKGTTGDFKKLPPSGPSGVKIKVLGDNNKGQDDYYVELRNDASGQSVWEETVAAGIERGLDSTTMPHQLISEADGTFTLEPMTFKEREIGDDDSNPHPSFVGLPINDIFFHRNRLGFLADENVIFSEAGEFENFNFYKRTVLTLLDSDPIDVSVSNNKVSILKHAVPFNEALLIFSDLTQFKLTAQDLLSPETVAIDVATQFEASLDAKPVGAGRYVFFGTNRGAYSGIREYFVDNDADVDDAADITAHIPNYIPGSISKLQASTNEDMLLALSDDEDNALFVYRYYWQGSDKLQSSWSRWTFDGKILNTSFNKSDIDILVEYTDALGVTHVCLERINLSVDEASEVTTNKAPILLDRRQRWDAATPHQDLFGPTGRQVAYVTQNGSSVTYEQAETYVNSGGIVHYGYPYMFRFIFSEQTIKGANEETILTGRLQLRNMTLVYSKTGFFKMIVTPEGRSPKESAFSSSVIGSVNNLLGQNNLETGDFRFPILARADGVTIELQSDSYLPCSFQSAEWEGFFVMRSRRL